jgi:hypothetical protein
MSIPWDPEWVRAVAPLADAPVGFGAWPLWVAGAGLGGTVVTRWMVKRFYRGRWLQFDPRDNYAWTVSWFFLIFGPLLALRTPMDARVLGPPGPDRPYQVSGLQEFLMRAPLPGDLWWSPIALLAFLVLATYGAALDIKDKFEGISVLLRVLAFGGSWALIWLCVRASIDTSDLNPYWPSADAMPVDYFDPAWWIVLILGAFWLVRHIVTMFQTLQNHP